VNPLVPALDPAPLPGPAWLFHILWVVTFSIHLLAVNMVLGGTLLSALSLARGKSPASAGLAAYFARINSWALSLVITFAIAPLLFLQLMYGRFFYTATILVAGAWLTLLGLVTVAYYLNYIAKRMLTAGKNPAPVVMLQALLFLAVAAIQVAVNLLHLRPDRWGAVSDHPWTVLADPSFVPRYLHFVLASVAVAGAVLAWWRLRSEATSAGPNGSVASFGRETRFGLHAALGATAVQLPVGFWLLFSLPREVLLRFLRGGAGYMMPLTLGILAAIGAIVALALCLTPLAKVRLVRHGLELIVGAVVAMVVTRHQLREAYLAMARVGEKVTVAPPWGVIGIFILCLLAIGGLAIWALRRAATDRPGPGEDAA
jgi:hypothetical protein